MVTADGRAFNVTQHPNGGFAPVASRPSILVATFGARVICKCAPAPDDRITAGDRMVSSPKWRRRRVFRRVKSWSRKNNTLCFKSSAGPL